MSSGEVNRDVVAAAGLDSLKADLAAQDVSAIYRSKAEAGIEFGQAFRTLQTLRSDAGEAVGEIVLPEGVERYGPVLHPVLLDGFTVKRATRAALLSAAGGLNDLFYEVAWRERQLDAGMRPADFLASPATVAAGTESFSRYLAGEGVEAHSRAVLLADLEACRNPMRLRLCSGWIGSAGLAHR